MKARLTILTIITWTSALGQTSITGNWKSISIGLTVEFNEKNEIKDRYDRVSYSFSADGSYTKSFYVPRQTREIPLYKNYEIKDDRLAKKQILTENGQSLKMVVVKEKLETGRFNLNFKRDSIVFHNNAGEKYQLGLRTSDSSLVLVDTIGNRTVYITLISDKKKQRKRGSS
jgi:hypothetical protein